jgi:hypothetical protein
MKDFRKYLIGFVLALAIVFSVGFASNDSMLAMKSISSSLQLIANTYSGRAPDSGTVPGVVTVTGRYFVTECTSCKCCFFVISDSQTGQVRMVDLNTTGGKWTDGGLRKHNQSSLRAISIPEELNIKIK